MPGEITGVRERLFQMQEYQVDVRRIAQDVTFCVLSLSRSTSGEERNINQWSVKVPGSAHKTPLG